MFGFQKWFDHKEVDELKENLPNDIREEVKKNKLSIVNEIEKSVAAGFMTENPYIFFRSKPEI